MHVNDVIACVGQIEDALKTIDEAIAMYPHEPYSHMLKGNIYFNNEDYIEATKQYRKVRSHSNNSRTPIAN